MPKEQIRSNKAYNERQSWDPGLCLMKQIRADVFVCRLAVRTVHPALLSEPAG